MLIYKLQQKPIKGQWPEITRYYVKDSLPHITFTKNKESAYVFEPDEAEEVKYLIDGRMEE